MTNSSSQGDGMAGMHMDHVHNCDAKFDPTKPFHYGHGAWLGHMLPGWFFLLWGTWWTLNVYMNHCRSLSGRRQYKAEPWYFIPAGPEWLRRFPMEPVVKILLPFVGINGELWAGHESWRSLIAPSGIFNVDNLNDWQHSCMYLAFLLSGVVDGLGLRRPLPAGAETAFLALAFLAEGVLLGFHLKGPDFEVIVHLLLVLTIVAAALLTVAEGVWRHSVMLSLARCAMVILQGTWFMQIAGMMYAVPYQAKWHPCYMGSAMFAPVYFTVHMLLIFFLLLLGLVISEAVYEKVCGVAPAGPRYHRVGGDEEAMETVEMSVVAKVRD